jgi:hypothetical protein
MKKQRQFCALQFDGSALVAERVSAR